MFFRNLSVCWVDRFYYIVVYGIFIVVYSGRCGFEGNFGCGKCYLEIELSLVFNCCRNLLCFRIELKNVFIIW